MSNRRPSRGRAWWAAVPADLGAVLAFLGVAAVLLAATAPGSAPYLLVAVPLLLFVPGYVVLAAAFPRRPDRETSFRYGLTVLEAGPTWIDRVVLSLPVSIALVPLVGGLLVALRRPFDPTTIAAILGGLVLVGTAVAWLRRLRVPADERLAPPGREWVENRQVAWFGTGSTTELLASVALLASVVLLVSSVVLAAGAPASDDSYTRLMLLSENESGDLTVGGFSTDIVQHRAVPVVVSVTNHEGAATDYTLVVRQEHLINGTSEVREARVLAREPFSLDPGATVNRSVTVTPREVGGDQRVSVYLYRGDPPASVGPATAYRHAYMSITVREPVDG
ncbi:DUF1616 domain-containing protein [Halobacteriales archaeon Cl-PHB]